MFVRIKSTPNSPRKSVQLVESVRDGNKVRQRIVRHIGIAMDDDELIKLKQVGEYVKAKLESQHQTSLFSPEQVASEVVTSKEKKTSQPKDTALNVDLRQLREEQRVITGIHEVYGHLFDELGFGTVIRPPVRYQSALTLFRHIVMARIANPNSKRASVNLLEQDFGVSLSLDKVYRMMDKLNDKAVERIKRCALEGTRQLFSEKINIMFFDCTTLYFESFKEDDLKSNGYSKDGKFNQPQVLLALLVTTEGLPVGYEVFPGSTFEGHTLQPVLEDLKSRYEVEDVVFVADRGLLSKENLTCLEERQVSYIVGGKLKSLPKKIQCQILQQREALYCLSDKNPKSYEFKHQERRWVVSYNHKRAEKDRSDREKAIKRLMKKVGKNKDPKALLNNYGYKKYLKITGKTDLSVDQDKVQQDAQWDGLHAVVTNLNMSASELFDHYRGLWQVEESFRITKHDLKVRPIYHWTPKRVKAHLAISFTAFSLVRFLSVRVKLQYKKLSPQVIRNALLHVQQSVVRHEKTGERYCIPSKISKEAEKIYQTLGLDLNRTPFKLSS